MSSISSAAVGMSEWHSPECSPRRMTASTRCRSVAAVKPQQAVAAYFSLAMTTLRKTVFHGYEGFWLREQRDDAHELTMFCTWAQTDSLPDMVTPRMTCDIGKQRWWSELSLSDLLRFNFSVRLLAVAVTASTLFSLLCLVSTLLAGTMIYVSSTHLHLLTRHSGS